MSRTLWSSMLQNFVSEPLPAVNVTAGFGATLDKSPVFKWSSVDGASEFELYISRAGSKEALYRARGLTGTEFTLPEKLSNGDYQFWMRVIGTGQQKSRWGIAHQLSVLELNPPEATLDQLSLDETIGDVVAEIG